MKFSYPELLGVLAPVITCSGAMKLAEPMVVPVRVRQTESSVWETPKSMTLGRPRPRSRWQA
jgi:hypothetical protein